MRKPSVVPEGSQARRPGLHIAVDAGAGRRSIASIEAPPRQCREPVYGCRMSAMIPESDRNGPERQRRRSLIIPGQSRFWDRAAPGEIGRERLTAAHNPEVAGSNPAPATHSARFVRIWPNRVDRHSAVLAGFSPEGCARRCVRRRVLARGGSGVEVRYGRRMAAERSGVRYRADLTVGQPCGIPASAVEYGGRWALGRILLRMSNTFVRSRSRLGGTTLGAAFGGSPVGAGCRRTAGEATELQAEEPIRREEVHGLPRHGRQPALVGRCRPAAPGAWIDALVAFDGGCRHHSAQGS